MSTTTVADVPDLPLAPPAPAACSRTGAVQGGFDVISLRSDAGVEATFAPQVGMACCSLRHDGAELLGERFGLAAYASCGLTMGMSLMHPWADRLAAWRYTAAGTTVRLPVSPLLHTDRWGLPVNGVQSSGHAWVVEDSGAAAGAAWLDSVMAFDRDPRRLAIFPFPHRLRLHAEVSGRTLRIDTEIVATTDVAVPVCFGYRLYLRREDATLVLPRRRKVVTDERLLPTGATEDEELCARSLRLDDHHEVFALGEDRTVTVASDARRLTLESLEGFPLAQVRAIRNEQHLMLEALTAAPDALSRDAFPVATRERPYRASLRISLDRLSR